MQLEVADQRQAGDLLGSHGLSPVHRHHALHRGDIGGTKTFDGSGVILEGQVKMENLGQGSVVKGPSAPAPMPAAANIK